MKRRAILMLNVDRPQLSAMSSCVRLELLRDGEMVEVRAVDPTTAQVLSRFTVPASHFREFVA